MSGIQKPAVVPLTEPGRTQVWVEFFNRLISRKPQMDEIHLGSSGVVYLGDSGIDGSWRIIRSGNNLLHQRREGGSWMTKDTITP